MALTDPSAVNAARPNPCRTPWSSTSSEFGPGVSASASEATANTSQRSKPTPRLLGPPHGATIKLAVGVFRQTLQVNVKPGLLVTGKAPGGVGL